jgi:hypothetical protein
MIDEPEKTLERVGHSALLLDGTGNQVHSAGLRLHRETLTRRST